MSRWRCAGLHTPLHCLREPDSAAFILVLAAYVHVIFSYMSSTYEHIYHAYIAVHITDSGCALCSWCADVVLLQVRDFRNDVILAEACRSDVETYCKDTPAGEGRVHTCLREKYDKLTEACRKEELKLAILQSQNTELMPNLAAACKVPPTAHNPAPIPGPPCHTLLCAVRHACFLARMGLWS